MSRIVTLAESNKNQPGRPEERTAIIRFSHIDAAGIVFYPRYFELLSQAFPELPAAVPPFAIQAEFLKSNRLGDQLTIVREPGGTPADWSFSGRMDDIEHFSIRAHMSEEPELESNAHGPEKPAFLAEAQRLGSWASDHTGRLQVSRFFELVNFATEQWFENMLGMPFHELHMVQGLGIPTVKMSTRSRELPKAGDSVTMWVRPTRIGNRSLIYTSWLVRDDECLVENEQVVVFAKIIPGGFETIAIPDDLRARLDAQLSGAGQAKK